MEHNHEKNLCDPTESTLVEMPVLYNKEKKSFFLIFSVIGCPNAIYHLGTLSIVFNLMLVFSVILGIILSLIGSGVIFCSMMIEAIGSSANLYVQLVIFLAFSYISVVLTAPLLLIMLLITSCVGVQVLYSIDIICCSGCDFVVSILRYFPRWGLLQYVVFSKTVLFGLLIRWVINFFIKIFLYSLPLAVNSIFLVFSIIVSFIPGTLGLITTLLLAYAFGGDGGGLYLALLTGGFGLTFLSFVCGFFSATTLCWITCFSCNITCLYSFFQCALSLFDLDKFVMFPIISYMDDYSAARRPPSISGDEDEDYEMESTEGKAVEDLYYVDNEENDSESDDNEKESETSNDTSNDDNASEDRSSDSFSEEVSEDSSSGGKSSGDDIVLDML